MSSVIRYKNWAAIFWLYCEDGWTTQSSLWRGSWKTAMKEVFIWKGLDLINLAVDRFMCWAVVNFISIGLYPTTRTANMCDFGKCRFYVIWCMDFLYWGECLFPCDTSTCYFFVVRVFYGPSVFCLLLCYHTYHICSAGLLCKYFRAFEVDQIHFYIRFTVLNS